MSSRDDLVQITSAPPPAGADDAARRQAEQAEEQARLKRRLASIRHTVIVLSGKGGVGKSTVAVNLAAAARRAGLSVGLLDVDIHGPSVPTMLGVGSAQVEVAGNSLLPVEVDGVKVMSMGFLIGDPDQAVVWRGPMKMKAISQFLADVEWGELELLVVDAPPGTGDEPLSVCQLLEHPDGAVVVTTPQQVAIQAVRKSVTFCRRLELPVLGVVENMSGFVCPGCGLVTEVFGAGAGERMAASMGVRFLGRVPIHPQITTACDAGTALSAAADPVVAAAFDRVAAPVVALAKGAHRLAVPSGIGKGDNDGA
jgi:ATP-binding protein involved in chromosome partitioning